MDFGTYGGGDQNQGSPRPKRPPPSRRSNPSPRVPRRADPAPPATTEDRYQPLIGHDAGGGYAQESGCSNCGAFNARGTAKFCDECGYSLGAGGAIKGGALSGGGWSCAPGRYAIFGWIETVLKIFAILAGIACLAALGPRKPSETLRVVQVVLTVLVLLGNCFLVFVRWHYREFTGLVLAIMTVVACIPLNVIYFHNNGRPGTFIVTFFFTMMLSEIIRLFYVLCFPPPEFDVEAQPYLDSKVKVGAVAGVFIFLYLIGFGLEITVLTSTFIEN